MRTIHAVPVLLSAALACASATAEILDFEALPSGDLTTTVVDLPRAHIQSLGTTLIAGEFFGGNGGSICAAYHPTSDATSCASDLLISFNTAVSQLSLYTAGYDDGDSVTISAYAGNALLGSQIVTFDGAVDFSNYTGITKLVFDDQSTGAGYAYGNFRFTAPASAVPEPTTILLTVLGMAAAFGARRRQLSRRAAVMR